MSWGWALDPYYPEGDLGRNDSRLQTATKNVFDRFVK